MSKQDNLNDFLTDVANAIRTKKGTTAKIPAQNFSSEILSIQTGSSSGGGEIDPFNPPVEKLWGVWAMSPEDFAGVSDDASLEAMMLSGIEFRSDNTVELGSVKLPYVIGYVLNGFYIRWVIDGEITDVVGLYDVVEDKIQITFTGEALITLHRVIGDTNVDECLGNWALHQDDNSFAGIGIYKQVDSLLGAAVTMEQYVIELLQASPGESLLRQPIAVGFTLDKQKIMVELDDSLTFYFKYDKTAESLCVPIELMQELNPDISVSSDYVQVYKSLLPETHKNSVYGKYTDGDSTLTVAPSGLLIFTDGNENLPGTYYCKFDPCYPDYTQTGVMVAQVYIDAFDPIGMEFIIGPGVLETADGRLTLYKSSLLEDS